MASLHADILMDHCDFDMIKITTELQFRNKTIDDENKDNFGTYHNFSCAIGMYGQRNSAYVALSTALSAWPDSVDSIALTRVRAVWP